MALQDFISAIKENGLIRSNRFTVKFDLPAGLRKNNYFGQHDLRTMMVLCCKANLPSISLATAPTRTFGEVRNVPYDRTFEPITLSFYADRDMGAKYLFDEWVNMIQNRTTRTFSYYNDYTIPKMAVEVQDVDDNTIYTITAHNVYPKTVSAIELDSSNSQMMLITVVFEYQYWESEQAEIEPYQDPTLDGLAPGEQFITIQGSAVPGIGKQLASGAAVQFIPSVNSILTPSINGLTGDITSRVGDLTNIVNTAAPGSFDSTNTSSYNTIMSQLTNATNTVAAAGVALASPAGLNIPPANLGDLSGVFNVARNAIGNTSALASVFSQGIGASGVSDLANKLGNIESAMGPAMANVANIQNRVSQYVQMSTSALTQLGKLTAPNQPKGQ